MEWKFKGVPFAFVGMPLSQKRQRSSRIHIYTRMYIYSHIHIVYAEQGPKAGAPLLEVACVRGAYIPSTFGSDVAVIFTGVFFSVPISSYPSSMGLCTGNVTASRLFIYLISRTALGGP